MKKRIGKTTVILTMTEQEFSNLRGVCCEFIQTYTDKKDDYLSELKTAMQVLDADERSLLEEYGDLPDELKGT